MFFNRIIMFLITTVLMAAYVYAQGQSVSQIGDIRIFQSADKFICDMIECPFNTERCIVAKSNEANPSILKRVNICFSKDRILAQKYHSTPTDPNYNVRQLITSYRNGGTITSDSVNTLDWNAFNQGMNNLNLQLRNMNENINTNIANQMQNVQESLNNLGIGLNNMFN